MSDIKEVVSLLSKAERRNFILHLATRNKRHDTRNIDLFKALINDGENIIKHKIGANAYNALKKRLSDRLLDYISTRSLETEVSLEVGIIKRLLLARKLFAYGKFKLAFKTLHKAEFDAIEISHYTLLNEIYHTLIEHSYHELSQDQSVLFGKIELNNTAFLEQEKLNIVYATLRKAYDAAEKEGESIQLELLLTENFEKYKISDQNGFSFQSLYQLALIADIAGSHTRNYHEIELFFIDKIQRLEGGAEDSEKSLLYHIDLLYSVANIFFRKKEFKKSLDYLKSMNIQMERFDKKYHEVALIKYTNLLALNYNYVGEFKEASELLDFLIKKTNNESIGMLTVKLTRVMIHFQQNELESASKILATFQHTDNWYEQHIGFDWVLNKNFIEILLHVEMNNVDFAESRINSFKRKYREYFDRTKQLQAMEFLKLVIAYYNNKSIVKTESFKKQVERSLLFKDPKKEDVLIMSYFSWLKAKMTGKGIYETTIDMITLK